MARGAGSKGIFPTSAASGSISSMVVVHRRVSMFDMESDLEPDVTGEQEQPIPAIWNAAYAPPAMWVALKHW